MVEIMSLASRFCRAASHKLRFLHAKDTSFSPPIYFIQSLTTLYVEHMYIEVIDGI